MDITSLTLADLATSQPGAIDVFRAHRLDFACRGRRSLVEACAERGIEPETVLRAIEAEGSGQDLSCWRFLPIFKLIDFIIERYHQALRRELPGLIAQAERVEQAPACRREVSSRLVTIRLSVLDHLGKEEEVLFPLIRTGQGAAAGGPVQSMELEHSDQAAALGRIRSLAAEIEAPPEAGDVLRRLHRRIDRLEAHLLEGIHLENNVLFPRAICE